MDGTLDDALVDELARQGAVEPDGHVARLRLVAQILRAVLRPGVAAIPPELTSRRGGVDVRDETAAHVVVIVRHLLPQRTAVLGIVQGHHSLACL